MRGPEERREERSGVQTVSASVSVPAAGRSTKISLPARMTDLYQTYPEDREGMVVAEAPEIVLTRPSISSTAPAEEKSDQ